MTTKTLSRHQARWAEMLASYDFIIKHRPGKKNPADGPSRRPDYAPSSAEERNETKIHLPIEDFTSAGPTNTSTTYEGRIPAMATSATAPMTSGKDMKGPQVPDQHLIVSLLRCPVYTYPLTKFLAGSNCWLRIHLHRRDSSNSQVHSQKSIITSRALVRAARTMSSEAPA